jgi:DNA invertase Pin-like site-specific DNA recombinase
MDVRDPIGGQGSKVQEEHQERLAMVYVRQSTPQQVLDHQESARLQYGLQCWAERLGWAPERVLIIDEDQGKTATSTVGRTGFQRLVSEVSLGHVGIILGIEMSRLARSCADWYQLIELCALFGTLLADGDGIYDPTHYNDRLLLGLKGTMSEAELHVLQQRLRQGRLNKARRGELAVPLPIGYTRRPSGEVTLDPDEQVQAVVRLIFRKFAELGTLNAVLRYLVTEQIKVGLRLREGPNRGELVWRRPNRETLQNLLHNPLYAGAYAYGRRPTDPRRKQAGRPATGRVVQPMEQWFVLLRDQHPAYISWDQYEQNCARLQANRSRAETVGAVRVGSALLTGLIVCGRCGCRMTVRYGNGVHRPTYVCATHHASYGDPLCQSLTGSVLDAYVSTQVLVALEPAALELSLAAAHHLERERADLVQLWQQRRERAAYEAERAARHYRAIEPENRLVARQLAREWEETLAAQQQLEEEYARFLQRQPRLLSPTEQTAIRELAANIPELWHAPETTLTERKEIVRQVVDHVEVLVVGQSEQVQVSIAWAGGSRTSGTLIRPVGRFDQLSYYPELCERIRILVAEGWSAAAIAGDLNDAGYRPAKQADRFSREAVQDLIQRLGLRPPANRQHQHVPLGADEWWLADLAHALAMPRTTLETWIKRGWVQARRQEQVLGRSQWVVWADQSELERLRRYRQRPAGAIFHERWIGGDRALDGAGPSVPMDQGGDDAPQHVVPNGEPAPEDGVPKEYSG